MVSALKIRALSRAGISPPETAQPLGQKAKGPVDDRPGHDRRYAIDAEKIGTEMGYTPQVTIDAGLRRTVRWYLDNEPWWRAALRRREGGAE